MEICLKQGEENEFQVIREFVEISQVGTQSRVALVACGDNDVSEPMVLDKNRDLFKAGERMNTKHMASYISLSK